MDAQKFDDKYEALLQEAWSLHKNGVKNEVESDSMLAVQRKVLAMQQDARREIQFITSVIFTEIEHSSLDAQSQRWGKMEEQARDFFDQQYETRTRLMAGTVLWMKFLLGEQEEAELLTLSRRYLEENTDDGIGRSSAERILCRLSDDSMEVIEILHANEDADTGYKLGLAYMAAAKLPAPGVESIAEFFLNRQEEMTKIIDPILPASLYERCIRRLCDSITQNADELMEHDTMLSQKTALIGRLKEALEELPATLKQKAVSHLLIGEMLWVINQTDEAMQTMCLGLKEAENVSVDARESGEWEKIRAYFQKLPDEWRRELESEQE